MSKELEIIAYNALPDDAALIRREVFMEEQGYRDEFDEVDDRAKHFVAYLGGEPAATCRVFKSADGEGLVLGRLAVRKAQRGHHLGSLLLEAVEKDALAATEKSISLHAQEDKRAFYEKCGYRVAGTRDYDEGVPHIWMKKVLKQLD